MWDRFLASLHPLKVACQHMILLALVLMHTFALGQDQAASGSRLKIWFDKPSSDWEREGLPIGNGALGAVVMGGGRCRTSSIQRKDIVDWWARF